MQLPSHGDDRANETSAAGGRFDNHGVEQPAKLVRVGAMLSQVLDELHRDGFTDQARERLHSIYATAIHELDSTLAGDVHAEFERITAHLSAEPSVAELRVAEAQVVGWLEGLLQGIQAQAVAQGLSGQLEQRRRQSREPPDRPETYL